MNGPRGMWPREHGAYAELGFPILTALALGQPTVPAVALAAASMILFVAHEPIVILRGGRGVRRQRAHESAARRRAALLVTVGLAIGVAGFVAAPAGARWATAGTALGAVLMLGAVVRAKEKTLVGELLMAVTFASLTVAVGLAAAVTLRAAVAAAVVWCTAFVVATLLVHATKTWHRVPPARVLGAAAPFAAGAVAVAAVVAAWYGAVSPPVGLAALPTPAVALVATALRVHPRQLRRIGWAIVTANAVTFALLVAA